MRRRARKATRLAYLYQASVLQVDVVAEAEVRERVGQLPCNDAQALIVEPLHALQPQRREQPEALCVAQRHCSLHVGDRHLRCRRHRQRLE
eukprot:333238-Rhodomonas_salina.1